MTVAVGVVVPGQRRDACREAEVDPGRGEALAHDDRRIGRRGHETPALRVEAPDEGAGAEARNGARWRQGAIRYPGGGRLESTTPRPQPWLPPSSMKTPWLPRAAAHPPAS